MKTLLILCVVFFLPCLALATPVPDTGQTIWYNMRCPQPGGPYYGQDAHYITNPQSYTKLDESGNDLPDEAPWPWVMVRDNVTGLVWEIKNSKDDVQDYGNPHDADNTYTWYDGETGTPGDGTDTLDFINALNSSSFGGFSDWRLPTVKELSFIQDKSRSWPSIDTDYFPNTVYFSYWSSTTCASYAGCAWRVGGNGGWASGLDKYNHCALRAVRGNTSSQNFINNNNGSVTDTDTGLMWQQNGTTRKQWVNALQYCENLSLADYDDWRLPNVHELQSLVDYSKIYPSIDTNYFPDTRVFYFSSTTSWGSSSLTWIVEFDDGIITDNTGNEKSNYFYVRCVRGGVVSLTDSDGDGIIDDGDNCACVPNSPVEGTCTSGAIGNPCANHSDCGENGFCSMNQEDNYPLTGNGIGDACDCESDFVCDGDVDGSDASTFKADYGRNSLNRLCTAESPCNGDFSCDGDVDGADAAFFKKDFGRSLYSQSPCPMCEAVLDWCSYQ